MLDFVLFIRLKKLGVAPFIALFLARPQNLIRLERRASDGTAAKHIIRVLLNFPLQQKQDFHPAAIPNWGR